MNRMLKFRAPIPLPAGGVRPKSSPGKLGDLCQQRRSRGAGPASCASRTAGGLFRDRAHWAHPTPGTPSQPSQRRQSSRADSSKSSVAHSAGQDTAGLPERRELAALSSSTSVADAAAAAAAAGSA